MASASLLAAIFLTALPWPGPVATPATEAAPVYPLALGPTGRYLVDQTGQPFFWSGDAAWSLIAQGTNADIDAYMADRQQKGFSVELVNLLEHKFADKAPSDINGDPPFTGRPFATPNQAYFAHADYLVQSAAARGLVVLLDALYLGFQCGDEGWCAEVQAASTSDVQSWGTYVGNRYKNSPNIVYVVGGDADPNSQSGLSAKVNAFATALQQADGGRHLITAHNARGQMAVTPWAGATWLTLNDTYTSYNGTYQQAQSAYNVAPSKPFFQIEGDYENASMTTQQLRAQAYWSVLSGGIGYVFGNCPLFGIGAQAASALCPSANPDWHTQLNGPGSTSMKNAQALFTSLAWQNLVPDWGHATVTAGYGTFGNTDYVTAGRASDGSLVVAYLPIVRAASVNMSQLSGSVTARWYDPSTGTYTAIAGSPFANSGTHQFTPPGSNGAGDSDWVLVLQTTPSPPPPPSGSPPPIVTVASPQRLVDTRVTGGPIAANSARCFTVAGTANVPTDAQAVVLNVTSVGQTSNGWLTVYPNGLPVPATSTLNFAPVQYATANGTLARIGSAGQVCVTVGTVDNVPGSTQLVLDVTGFLPSGAAANLPMLAAPLRLADTRLSGGPIAAATSRCFAAAGVAGIPSNATAVVLNVTAVAYPVSGWLTVFPNGQSVPPTSTVNFDQSAYAVANGTLAAIGSSGQVCVNVGTLGGMPGSAHVILDATGYLTAAAQPHLSMLPVPERHVDTRTSGGAITSGSTRCFALAGTGGIPSTASGVALNVTADGYATNGWLTVYPTGQPVPPTSTLDFDTDQYAVANGAIIGLGTAGQLCVHVGTVNGAPGGAQVILDVVGYLTP